MRIIKTGATREMLNMSKPLTLYQDIYFDNKLNIIKLYLKIKVCVNMVKAFQRIKLPLNTIVFYE